MATKVVIRRGRAAGLHDDEVDFEEVGTGTSTNTIPRIVPPPPSSSSNDFLATAFHVIKESCGAFEEEGLPSSSTSLLLTPTPSTTTSSSSPILLLTPQERRKQELNAVTLYLFMNVTGYFGFYLIKQSAMLSPILSPGDPEAVPAHLCFAFYDLFLFSLIGLVSTFCFRFSFYVRELIFSNPSNPSSSPPDLLSPNSLLYRCVRYFQIGFLVIWQALITMFVVVEGTVYADMAAHTYEFDWLRIISDSRQQKDLGLSKKDHASRVAGAIALVIAIQGGFFYTSVKLAARWRMAAKRCVLVATLIFLVAGFGFFFFNSELDNHRAEVRIALLMSQYWDPEDARVHLDLRLHWDKPEDQVKHAVLNDDEELQSKPTNRAFDIAAGAAGYPMGTKDVLFPPPEERKNFVFTIAESWRHDVLTAELMPNLMKLVNDDPSCFQSKHHYTTGHVTELGSYGLVYALPATSYHDFSKRKIPSFPLRVLEEKGYVIAALCASFPWGYPNNYVFTQFPNVKLVSGEMELIHEIELFLEERRKDGKNYALFTFFNDPHYPYSPANSTFLVKKPYLVKGQFELMMNTEERMELYWNSYHNTIMSLDDSFRKLRLALDREWREGKLTIAFAGDHGQEMYEHGGFGHAGVTFWNEKVKTPFVMCVPGEDRRARVARDLLSREEMLTSHVDIWPTFFDSMNIRTPIPWTAGHSLLRLETDTERKAGGVILTGRHFPNNLGRLCAVINRRCKYWFVFTDRTYTDKKIVRVTDVNDQVSDECSQFQEEGTRSNVESKLMLLNFDRELRRTFIVEMDEYLDPELRKTLLPKH